MDDPEPYRGNLFPVDVVGPDGTEYKSCRVIASSDGTTVWAWSNTARTGIAVYVTDRQPIPTGEADVYTLELDSGGQVDLFKRKSCGCSSPMKRWVPPKPSKV